MPPLGHGAVAAVYDLPSLVVLGVLLRIDPDDRNDADDVETLALLLARRPLREAGKEQPPPRQHLHVVR
jgi:hypothetical protein